MTFQRSPNGDQQPSAAGTAPAAVPAQPGPESQRIGRISYSSAEAAWPSAAPLARWLRANPDVLAETLGTPLQATSDEVPGLAAAVIFVDPTGKRTLAVLEVGPSSEATLGSLLTRLSTAQAGSAVWICGEARDEHVSAISWLNHSVEGRFFIARVRAARIDASDPAPIIEMVVRPPRPDRRAEPNGVSPERTRRASDHHEVVVDGS